MDDKARDVIAAWERGDSDRQTTKTYWQRCAQYMQPARNDYIVERTPGTKRTQWIYDGSPVWCVEQFAAGLHSLLTSPTLQWFYLRTGLERLDGDEQVRAWLDSASAAMYAIFNSPRHNFASQSQELYADLGVIGTGNMAVLESAKSGILFSTRHMKECVFFENDEDRVDHVVRRWPFTADQAFRRWGQKAGAKVLKAIEDKKGQTKFTFLHSVKPRLQRNPERGDNLHMMFESIYVSEADGTVISESGFSEFPFCPPRLQKYTGETYGRGIGMTTLPDVQMLNEMVKLVLKSAQKLIDPPLQAPDSTFLVPIKSVPGAVNFYRAGTRPTDRIEPIKTGGDAELGVNLLEGLRNQINRAWYVDLLRMPTNLDDPSSDGKGSTATYWMQRREKEMMALSPLLSRAQAEFLGPLIDRVFAILWRQSKAQNFGPNAPFPPPPPQLSGAKLTVEYVSPIAIAQKSSQLDSVQALIQQQLALRQIDPQCPIVLDMEAVMRMTARDRNAPVAALKSVQRMQDEAQQKAEADAAMQNHMALANVAGAAKDGSVAAKNIAQLSGGNNDNQQQQAA